MLFTAEFWLKLLPQHKHNIHFYCTPLPWIYLKLNNAIDTYSYLILQCTHNIGVCWMHLWLLILPQKWDRTLGSRRPANLSNLKLSVQPFDRHSVSAFTRYCAFVDEISIKEFQSAAWLTDWVICHRPPISAVVHAPHKFWKTAKGESEGSLRYLLRVKYQL